MRYLAADVGGTFTDLVLVDGAAGAPRVFIDKVPSQATGSAAGVEEGIRRIAGQAGIAPGEIDLFVHGFTVGTNAFLTRSGARAVLVVTEGFRDVLTIGDQRRPDIYALTAEKPAPVVPLLRAPNVTGKFAAIRLRTHCLPRCGAVSSECHPPDVASTAATMISSTLKL